MVQVIRKPITQKIKCGWFNKTPMDLPVDKIEIGTYQRDQVEGVIESIHENFNPYAFERITVGKRIDETYWVVEGQQRLEALKLLIIDNDDRIDGGNGLIPCEVFESNGPEHEAEVFEIINDTRRKLSQKNIHNASLVRGTKESIILEEICEEFGLTTDRTRRNEDSTPITCIGKLRKLIKTNEVKSIRFAMRIISKSWPGESKAFNANLIGGLVTLKVKWNEDYLNKLGELNEELMISSMKNQEAKVFLKRVEGRGQATKNEEKMIEKILEVYKKALKE